MGMLELEIRERLKFSATWWELGIVDEQWMQRAVQVFREGNDQADEHYRYGAFVAFLQRTPVLTERQCEALIELGANDPHWSMGTSIMRDVLRRPECPERLLEMAAKHARTMKCVAKLREKRALDPVKHREEMLALGVEGYYRRFGYRKDGRRQADQSVYREMKDLFGVNLTTFREVRNRLGDRRE